MIDMYKVNRETTKKKKEMLLGEQGTIYQPRHYGSSL